MNAREREEEIRHELAESQQVAAGRVAQLSQIERDCLHLVCAGFKDRQIANCLHADEASVRKHLHSLYQKLGVSSRLELVIYARHFSLTELPC